MRTPLPLPKRKSNWSIFITGIIVAGLMGCDPSTGSLETTDTSTPKTTADTTDNDSPGIAPGEVIQLTNDPADQMNPNISVDRIVYDDNRNGNLDIFVYCLTNQTETQVTSNPNRQANPDISEGRIVWSDSPEEADTTIIGTDIFFLNLADMEEIRLTFTDTPVEEDVPEISGSHVIWDRNFRGHYGGYNLANDSTFFSPRWPGGVGHGVWKNQAIFSGYTGGSRSDLYLCDLDEGTCDFLFLEPGAENYPDIYENYIVWQNSQTDDIEDENWDIILYNLTTETMTQITSESGEQDHPAIYGNYIVWEDNRNGNDDIFLYNIATQAIMQITTDSNDQRDPAIYGNYIVWEDNRNGNWDIFFYEIQEDNSQESLAIN